MLLFLVTGNGLHGKLFMILLRCVFKQRREYAKYGQMLSYKYIAHIL